MEDRGDEDAVAFLDVGALFELACDAENPKRGCGNGSKATDCQSSKKDRERLGVSSMRWRLSVDALTLVERC